MVFDALLVYGSGSPYKRSATLVRSMTICGSIRHNIVNNVEGHCIVHFTNPYNLLYNTSVLLFGVELFPTLIHQ